MTSFNHYALGAVADFPHRTVAGLAPVSPGYRRPRIAPRPGGGLTHASAELDTPYGPASVAWNTAEGTLTVTATIPPGTLAEVDLQCPGTTPTERRGYPHAHRLIPPTAPGVSFRQSPRGKPSRPVA
jgi:alpha-L-rhamnosidase